jgi:organic radical activating enzyme
MSGSENKTFCVLPWVNLTTDPSGKIRPCCVSKDFIKKEDGTVYNAGYDSIEEIYNSPDYVEIRRKMLAGEEVSGCTQCYQQEKYNNESNRTLHNDIWYKNPLYLRKRIQRTNITPTINYFDLRFGNLCNLNCRSCGPESSSQFAKELHEIDHPEISKYHSMEIIDTNSWYNTDVFIKNIQKQLPNIQQLYLTGGEPTIIDKNYEILQLLIDKGFNKTIRIVFNSNMTNTNPKFFSLIKQFNHVTFYASIDGYGTMQEYLRFPSKWSQIDSNIQKILSMTNAVIRPTPVIQIANLSRITELFEYFENFNRIAGKTLIDIRPIILENPSRLDMVNLPLEYKKQAWGKIQEWLNTSCKYQGSLFHSKLKSLQVRCFTETEYTNELAEFYNYNDIFDNHRNHYLRDINPELDSLRAK